MLDDISRTLTSWEKVSSGMLKLFQGEVLDKRPVVQHFEFGEIFQATWKPLKIPSAAPTGTFDAAVHGVAPWAKKSSTATATNHRTTFLPPAPLRTEQPSPDVVAMPSTRAPWAK